ncbi:hypothetical protein NDU88_006844 [Pleurodeles waltl]|uniref:Uncharacterized protein n=1 Tax=Pleurodeles waltl TaxID=8319 RepID=A0AAV7WZE7_PLEWA|nr:hypothetical protein NDU88_006844 [Pleurodeles waltl]
MEATDRILQEIVAVRLRLEEMDAKISDLTVASTTIWADISSFRETVTDLNQRLSIVEDRVAVLPDQEAEMERRSYSSVSRGSCGSIKGDFKVKHRAATSPRLSIQME